MNLGLTDPPETYHTSDHLFEDLSISPDVTGRLPRAQRTREGLGAETLEDLGGSSSRSGGPKKDGGGRGSGGGKPAGRGHGAKKGHGGKESSSSKAEGEPRSPRQRNRRRVSKPQGQEGGNAQ